MLVGYFRSELVFMGDMGEEVRCREGEFEEVVCFVVYDDKVLFLRGVEFCGGGDGVEKVVEMFVVVVGSGVVCCSDDVYFDVFFYEVCFVC